MTTQQYKEAFAAQYYYYLGGLNARIEAYNKTREGIKNPIATVTVR